MGLDFISGPPYTNSKIRRVDPQGIVTNFAGSPTQATGSTNGVGTAALFWFPLGALTALGGPFIYLLLT